MELRGDRDNARGGRLVKLGGTPHEREEAVYEEEMTKMVHSEVTINAIAGNIEFVNANSGISDDLS